MNHPMTDNDKMPFGKYEGKSMIEVPASYLLWLHEKGCFNHDVRKYINDNLEAIKMEAKKDER